MKENEITAVVIGAAIEVHRVLGPGLLESAYQQALCRELSLRGLSFVFERPMPINYKGMLLDCEYRIDLLVEDKVIVELKSVEKLLPIHELSGLHIGLLINFNVEILRQGIRRMVHEYEE
jgi:GxxExxY protein